jgi:ADP-ribose pyrophosphatase
VAVEHWPGGIEREVVYHPGACAAVVFVDESNVLLVRQTRQAVRRETLEVVAGTRDIPGESFEDTIHREIEEETGYRATGLERIGSILTTPGFTNERIELFVATAEPSGAAPSEDGIGVVVVPFNRAIGMALSGEIDDAKSVVALLLTRERRATD